MSRPFREHAFFLFVYGTLKCGFENHDKFCQDALEIEEASVCGRLYDLPFGFPALLVPEETIHAAGTKDAIFDAATQHRLNKTAPILFRDEPRAFGELLTFDDPEERLPLLDRLEGFDPKGRSLYRRALIPAETATRSILVWTYVIEKPTGTHLPGGHWPA